MAEQKDGRAVSRPSGFRLREWKSIFFRLIDQIGRDRLGVVAAGVAFYAVIALFPAIAALVGLYGFLADPADIAEQLQGLRGIVPENVYTIIETQVGDLAASGSQTLGLTSVFAILVALWGSRSGVGALVQGLNIVYKEDEARSYLLHLIVSLALTLMTILMVMVALLAIVVVPALLNLLQLDAISEWAIRLLRWPMLMAVVMLTIGALYRYGPNRARAEMPWVSWGSAVATLLWLAASVGFSRYVAEFGRYNEVYGSLGAIIILLFWLYISAFVVLLGAELNAELELHTRADTTTGPDRAMGERGAYVADHVIDAETG